MQLNRWWAGRPAEIYWLETTDRADLGVDLRAPQRDDGGAENWSYALLTEVEDGDVVFHYELAELPIEVVDKERALRACLW